MYTEKGRRTAKGLYCLVFIATVVAGGFIVFIVVTVIAVFVFIVITAVAVAIVAVIVVVRVGAEIDAAALCVVV